MMSDSKRVLNAQSESPSNSDTPGSADTISLNIKHGMGDDTSQSHVLKCSTRLLNQAIPNNIDTLFW
jgi:hypothetical protein